jgi:VRR-NUC domain.
MLEKDVVRKIKTMLEKEFQPCKVNKIHGGPYQSAGISDLICCIKGRYVAIEVKQPGKEKTLTELQKKFLRDINECGGIAFMATSPESVREKLKEAGL